MLTKSQHECLAYIADRLQEFGICPSYDEIRHHLDLKSKSGINRIMRGLEERGFIRRLPYRSRAVEIIKLPPDLAAKFTHVVDRGRAVLAVRNLLSALRQRQIHRLTPDHKYWGKVVAAMDNSKRPVA